MALYKATKEFKSLENKYFGIHQVNHLLQGGNVEITNINSISVDFVQADAQSDNKIRMESAAIKLAIDDTDVLNIEDGKST